MLRPGDARRRRAGPGAPLAAVLAWVVAGVPMLSLVPGLWLVSRTWLAGVEEATPTIATVGPVVLAVVSAMTVGALVAGRRPRHPVGWLLIGVGLGVMANVLVEPYAKYGLPVRPGSLPSPRWRWWARLAAATLAVAAIFQPARRRVQAAVDRRFNRRRHDAARIIEGFSERLRQEVDLDALRGELLLVVDRTMQPTQASLWLRPRTAGEQTSS